MCLHGSVTGRRGRPIPPVSRHRALARANKRTRKATTLKAKTKRGNGQRGVYPLEFRPFGGRGETRPRQALPRAPTCPNCNLDALARRPQPMPSTHTLFCFFWARPWACGAGGGKRIPPFDYKLGGYIPANLLNLSTTPN